MTHAWNLAYNNVALYSQRGFLEIKGEEKVFQLGSKRRICLCVGRVDCVCVGVGVHVLFYVNSILVRTKSFSV